MSTLRAGILGCGGFAHRHAQILAALSDQVEMVAFCSRNPANAQAFADQYTGGQGAVFTDHHAMFEQAGLDLVIICLPPHGHTDEVERAAERVDAGPEVGGAYLAVEVVPVISALRSSVSWAFVLHLKVMHRGGYEAVAIPGLVPAEKEVVC